MNIVCFWHERETREVARAQGPVEEGEEEEEASVCVVGGGGGVVGGGGGADNVADVR